MSDFPPRSELTAWANKSVAFYGLDLSRVGSLLLAQLREIESSRLFSIFNITDELKTLEGLPSRSATPEPSPFNHPPLVGLHKKHFTDPRFLARNLANFTQSKRPMEKEHRRAAWSEAAERSQDGTVDQPFVGYFVHAMVVGAYEKKVRSNSMTGEWIVFAKRPKGNYYFTLAGHEEANEAIYERVTFCAAHDGYEL